MTDHPDSNAAPPSLTQAVKNLWDADFKSEKAAFASAHFRMLYNVCASLYPEIPGSRLTVASKSESDESHYELTSAIRNFFRWGGAPWYAALSGSAAPEPAATRLHSAFLMGSVNRTYLAPLDCLGLEEELRRACFGNAEIALMDDEYIKNHLPLEALQRFGQRCTLPIEQIKDFYYLVVDTVEPAGPIWRRGHRGQMAWWHEIDGKSLSEINELDRINIYHPIYPDPVEDALFPVLLCFLNVKKGEKPFSIPWVYSITNDPFAEAPLSPDPSSLSFTLVSGAAFEDPYEVPDRSNYFKFAKDEIEKSLRERWQRLRSALERAANGNGNFHPLTKHFFIKAFAENGIDEIVALISCIEATLKLHNEKHGRANMKERCKKLLNDDNAYDCLAARAYDLRDTYLHGYGESTDQTSWENLSRIRSAVTRVVDSYLALAETRSGEDRRSLLKSYGSWQPEWWTNARR